MEDKKKLTLFERYLTREIGIEFKACLYFYGILFFYCVYRLCIGVHDAGILHMAEMILACYLICYLQVYGFKNFDEGDSLGVREWEGILVCTAIYTLLSYFLGWFDKLIAVTAGFILYLLILYICVFLVYRTKRRIDDRVLNEELLEFQTEHQKVQDTDE